MKTASWFMAIAKDDEEALQAFELLRKRGCFNTRLWKWHTRDEMQLIKRWYITPKQPMIEIQRRRLYGQMDSGEQELAKTLDYHQRMRARWSKQTDKMKRKIERLESKIRGLEAEISEAEGQAQYMDEAFEYAIQCGLLPGWSQLPDINQFGIEKDKIGSAEFAKQVARAIDGMKSGSNERFVTADMSATLGRGTHVLIDVDKVPKELQVLLANMMDTLNNHSLRISNLENC